MVLAFMTSGQYVPMLNSQLLANVIMGRVREEISLDRLMKDALPDVMIMKCESPKLKELMKKAKAND